MLFYYLLEPFTEADDANIAGVLGFFFPGVLSLTCRGQHISNSAVLSTKKQKLTFHIENNFIYRKKYFEK